MTASSVTIRPEQAGDIPAIHSLNGECFPSDCEAQLVDLLRDAGRLTVSLVAIDGDDVVGHVAFSPVTADGYAAGAGLAPLAVAPSRRRRGIAEALVRAGLDAVSAQGFTWAVVLGEPAYYSRFGFLSAPQFGLSDEYGGGNAFQVMPLAAGGVPTGAGLVRYAPEFASLG
jgi:putative acetyltransferase